MILLDGGHLAAVRARIHSGDDRLRTALEALEQDGRKAMTVTPVSVMDKAVTPPSGDKHDYMSQAPYWWPDPAQPDGRPYIRRDGERNPEIRRIGDHDSLGRLTNAVCTPGCARISGGWSKARTALDFLVPYAEGKRPWPYRQITTFQPGALHWLLRRAASSWREPAYRTLAMQAGGGNARLDLTVE